MNAQCGTAAPTVSRPLMDEMAALVERVTGNAPRVTGDPDARHTRLAAPLDFPDGIGSGRVVVTLVAAGGRTQLTLRLEHNRVFATPRRAPSPSPCFLNDFVASIGLAAEDEALPAAFVRQVVAGVSAARTAVDRYNRANPAPWFRIAVTVGDEAA